MLVNTMLRVTWNHTCLSTMEPTVSHSYCPLLQTANRERTVCRCPKQKKYLTWMRRSFLCTLMLEHTGCFFCFALFSSHIQACFPVSTLLLRQAVWLQANTSTSIGRFVLLLWGMFPKYIQITTRGTDQVFHTIQPKHFLNFKTVLRYMNKSVYVTGRDLAPFWKPTGSHHCGQKKSALAFTTMNIQMLVESIILTPRKRKFGFHKCLI